MTGSYRFNTVFYVLTDMTADSQKAMDHNLIGLKKTFCFIVGIIIMSKGSEDKNFQLATDCSKKKLRIKNFVQFSALYITSLNLSTIEPIIPSFTITASKQENYNWTDVQTTHYNAVETRIENQTENSHYKLQLETPVKCDAARSGPQRLSKN